MRANAGKYGLDPDHFGAWGSSAGGHLAALLGTAGDAKEFEVGDYPHVSSRVQAVCDYFGPSDLTAMARETGFENHGRADSPEGLLLGGTVGERREQARKASPVTYVSEDDPPFLIVHGEKDRTVPPSQSKRLHDSLVAVGVESTLKMLPDAAHGGPGFSTSDMVALVSSFFDKHLVKAR